MNYNLDESILDLTIEKDACITSMYHEIVKQDWVAVLDCINKIESLESSLKVLRSYKEAADETNS